MPSISEDLHAKMSFFARRKPTSALSYLGDREVPMRTTLFGALSGSIWTILVSSVGSKEPADLLASGQSSVAPFLALANSVEAMVAAVSSTHSTSHSYVR
jgi:hypothetical protein